MKDTAPVEEESLANVRRAGVRVIQQLGYQVPVLSEDKGGEDAEPGEVEAHAQVEDCVQVLSSPDLASKRGVGDNRDRDQEPFYCFNQYDHHAL